VNLLVDMLLSNFIKQTVRLEIRVVD